MSARASLSESAWQTTRVRQGAESFSAEASERAFGTAPPAAGCTEVSGAGSGQYDVRSTCANADELMASTSAHTTAPAAAPRERMSDPATGVLLRRVPDQPRSRVLQNAQIHATVGLPPAPRKLRSADMAEVERTPHTRTASYLAEVGEVSRVLL